MMIITNTISMQEAQRKLAEVLEDIGRGNPYFLTRRGKPKAVILSVEDYEDMMEESMLSANPSHRALVNKARDEAVKGETVSLVAYKSKRQKSQ